LRELEVRVKLAVQALNGEESKYISSEVSAGRRTRALVRGQPVTLWKKDVGTVPGS
jgi:hypothetical protein